MGEGGLHAAQPYHASLQGASAIGAAPAPCLVQLLPRQHRVLLLSGAAAGERGCLGAGALRLPRQVGRLLLPTCCVRLLGRGLPRWHAAAGLGAHLNCRGLPLTPLPQP